MSLPLKGVKIVELSTMITGPLAGMLLADLGADVVKIENPKGGDPFRSFRGGDHSPYFLAYNRNKRSLALDLRSPVGKAAMLELCRAADVLIENFRPGVLDKLGFDRQRLQKLNPRLIICSISGFGKDGPYAERPAYDAVAQAISGLSSLFFCGEPQITGPSIADNMTGIFACYGVLAAIVERERTGVARVVETNMIDSTIAFTPDTFLVHTLLNVPSGPVMRVSASQSYAVRCQDGKDISIHMSSQVKFWEGCIDALECKHLDEDPRFDDRAKRVDNYVELAAELRKAALRKPRSYWMKRLEERDVPHGAVNSLSETIDDEQVRHLGTFVDLTHHERGPYKAIRRPVSFDGNRSDQPLAVAPDLNGDGEKILRAIGFSDAAIADWQKECERARA